MKAYCDLLCLPSFAGFVLDEDSGKVLMIQDKHRVSLLSGVIYNNVMLLLLKVRYDLCLSKIVNKSYASC